MKRAKGDAVMDRAKVGDVWHRFEDVRYAAPLDEFDEPCGFGTTRVVHYAYTVTKVTPCGVWVSYEGITSPRFVLESARKRFACPTRAEALDSFLARKRKQARILSAQLDGLREVITQAEAMRRGVEVAS